MDAFNCLQSERLRSFLLHDDILKAKFDDHINDTALIYINIFIRFCMVYKASPIKYPFIYETPSDKNMLYHHHVYINFYSFDKITSITCKLNYSSADC